MLKTKLLLLIVLLGTAPYIIQAQTFDLNLHPPLGGGLYLSGSFGEIRSGHFHSGIDFRTGGRTGMSVYASEDGFVSRVSVSGTGFGKAVYIQHPNGLTTVYAHLESFIPELDWIVKQEQYSKESFEVNLFLNKDTVVVSRGDAIGLSGNTGSSGGPHLHYEVRETHNQRPINPSFSNLPINDVLNPVIRSAYIYSMPAVDCNYHEIEREELTLSRNRQNYTANDTIHAWGYIGFGVEAYDYINNSSLRCGVYRLKMLVNDSVWYEFSVDGFKFGETRYVKSHTDYELSQTSNRKVHRLFIDPNNQFSGYRNFINSGLIELSADSIYNIQIEVTDPSENISLLNATVKGIAQGLPYAETKHPKGRKSEEWLYHRQNTVQTDLYRLSLPKNSLYRNLTFTHGASPKPKGYYSQIAHIHNRLVPVHKAYRLSIAADSLPLHLRQRALLAKLNSDGETEAVGGSFSNGAVNASLREFGDFFVAVDTIPPTITPLNISSAKDMSSEVTIRFRVEDDFSGVATIRGTINETWALFEHDPKNNLVFYTIDHDRLSRDKSHKLSLEVWDKVGNRSVYTCNFDW